MTERLYERDSYCRQFKATVQSCEPARAQGTDSATDDLYSVVLDRTAFFPEGGGQAADLGIIRVQKTIEKENEETVAEVLDVQIKGDTIIHTTRVALPVGQEVEGRIDWDLRFERMQSHSGEHILSGIVHSMFGYSNVGFHMSDAVMTVDFNGPLSPENIEEVELRANHAIYQNVDIIASFPSEEELAETEYRSKIDFTEGVRLITIDGIDCCACCAPHTAKTGEIGIVKIVNFYPYKGGTRVEMLAGVNAFKDYLALNNTHKHLMSELSAPRDGVVGAVERQGEIVNSLRAENKGMLKKLALCELKPVAVGDSAYAIMNGVGFDELRLCANTLMEQGAKVCVLLSKVDNGEGGDACGGDASAYGVGYLYVVGSKSADVRDIVKELNAAFNGKGGGKPEYSQGKLVVDDESDLKEFVERVL